MRSARMSIFRPFTNRRFGEKSFRDPKIEKCVLRQTRLRGVMVDLPCPFRVVVLVVEDAPLTRMLVADVLSEAGFDVLVAENADEAIRILECRQDVRIVFTDIDMPGSMDGLKLATFVRGRWPPIEIVVTSGHREVSESELPSRSVFIPKPYRHDKVVETLRDLAL